MSSAANVFACGKRLTLSHMQQIYSRLLWKCVDKNMENLFNPFPHTTVLQQTTLNIFCQKMENLYNWMDNLWLKVENIVAKGEIARFEQFLILSLFSKSRLLQRCQKVIRSVYLLNGVECNFFFCCNVFGCPLLQILLQVGK